MKNPDHEDQEKEKRPGIREAKMPTLSVWQTSLPTSEWGM